MRPAESNIAVRTLKTKLNSIYRYSMLFTLSFLICVTGCKTSTSTTQASTHGMDEALEKAAQLVDSIKCITPSPQWYKNLWLDLNAQENFVGRDLMKHYMGCTGTKYHLNEEAFRFLPIQLVPQSLGSSRFDREFIDDLIRTQKGTIGSKIVDVDESVLARTHYGNTLGNFQLEFRGVLIWSLGSSGKLVPHFKGKARARDRYDFNPSGSKPTDSWRGRDTELRVRIAHIALPGRAFELESEWIDLSFDYPTYDSDFIQESVNNERSGYSQYGERVQAILTTELRSSRWEKASHLEKLKIILTTMRRIHEALPRESVPIQ